MLDIPILTLFADPKEKPPEPSELPTSITLGTSTPFTGVPKLIKDLFGSFIFPGILFPNMPRLDKGDLNGAMPGISVIPEDTDLIGLAFTDGIVEETADSFEKKDATVDAVEKVLVFVDVIELIAIFVATLQTGIGNCIGIEEVPRINMFLNIKCCFEINDRLTFNFRSFFRFTRTSFFREFSHWYITFHGVCRKTQSCYRCFFRTCRCDCKI